MHDHDEYPRSTMPPSAAKTIQEAAGYITDTNPSGDDYPVKTVEEPVAVHIFHRRVIIVGRDGTVMTLARR